ncbi:hypothetical protein K503DRAFT_784667 [Rhizopogon vinicolor AM-OR11-026]|uniref:DUF6533 domain-containing protein n=1 Tax=Rhizopogon vinicolor AM-OR11-026 TaxID=1314800 RepID=A0A1B7MTS4_9AGAM|nr:hypothetical protein K503DRAFT_784667 [Rhizopogon vinicolor AM-OR11-026]
MSTTVTPAEIQAMELYLLAAPTLKYISLAALTLFTWDLRMSVLTFPHETLLRRFDGNRLDYGYWLASDEDLLQNTRWTPVKALFLLNRYFALGAAILTTFLTFDVTPTETICSANAFFGVIALLLVANIELILQHRLFALYGYDRRIVLPVLALFIAVFSTMMVMAVIVYLYEKDHEVQIFGTCSILGVPMMGLDFVLVVLAGYKSLQHYFQIPDKTWSGARLMRIFARDSILYFFCNFLVYLFSTLLGKFGPSEYYQLGAITITLIPPVSVNRLLINMYDSAHGEESTWAEASKTKASHQVKDALSVHNGDIELEYMCTKGSRWTEASSLDDIGQAI